MREWFTAAELAGVPGLPSTERGVQKTAEAKTWQWRPREGRGGGREYHVSALPARSRAALARQAVDGATNALVVAAVSEQRKAKLRATIAEAARRARREQGLARFALMKGAPLVRADARDRAVSLLKQFKAERNIPMKAARAAFTAEWNEGTLQVDADLRAALPRISAPSLLRWQRKLKRFGIAALAGEYGNRKDARALKADSAMGKIVVGMMVINPKSTAEHVMNALAAKIGRDDLPSYRTLQRFIARWKREHAQTFTALANPDAWKGKYMVAAGSASEDVAGLNHRWEMDSTPADVMLADGRHAVIGVIDVWSRRARLLVSRTSKSTAIAALLRRTFLEWGVPREIKTDNGQDYTSKHIQRALAHLEIEQSLCAPFSPWQKPHIERFFRTFSHHLVELLPGYVGHDVAEREAIRARKSFADRLTKRGETVEIALTAEELQDVCDRWCADVYAHNAHRGLKGKTPFARAAEWREPSRRVKDARALDVLLAAAPGDGWRTVGKKGLSIDGGTFLAPELEAHVGNRVQVRYDETDLGRVYVFDDNDAFVCVAEDPVRLGVSPKEAADVMRRRQRERVQEERRALKARAKEADLDNIAQEILAEARTRNASVVPFPAPAAEHETPALAGAAEAATSAPRQAAPLTDEQRAAADAAWNRAKTKAAPDDPFQDDVSWARWALGNPAELNDMQRAYLKQLLLNPAFRELVGFDARAAG